MPPSSPAPPAFPEPSGNFSQTKAWRPGPQVPLGTNLEPGATPAVGAGALDPVSGLVNPSASTVYVRDPFGTCPTSTTNFTLAGCGLNQLPAARLDPNAIKLLNLYPLPSSGGLSSNFASS